MQENLNQWSTGRSTANGHNYDRWANSVDRPVDPNKQRALLSDPVDRSVDRPMCQPDVHKAVHVGRPFGRPATGSVDRTVDRPSLSGTEQGQKNL